MEEHPKDYASVCGDRVPVWRKQQLCKPLQMGCGHRRGVMLLHSNAVTQPPPIPMRNAARGQRSPNLPELAPEKKNA